MKTAYAAIKGWKVLQMWKKEDLTSGNIERVFAVRWLLITYSAKPLVPFLGTKYYNYINYQ